MHKCAQRSCFPLVLIDYPALAFLTGFLSVQSFAVPDLELTCPKNPIHFFSVWQYGCKHDTDLSLFVRCCKHNIPCLRCNCFHCKNRNKNHIVSDQEKVEGIENE